MSRRAWLAFGAISVIWGIPYLLIRIAVRHGMTPAFLAWGRVTLAAVVLLALAWQAGTLSSLRGRWRVLLVYAVVEICIPFPMIAAGETRVSSSLAAILISSVPLIVCVRAALRSLRAADADPRARAAVGLWRRHRAGGHRRGRQGRRTIGGRSHPAGGDGVRHRSDAGQAPAGAARSSSHDGRQPRHRLAAARSGRRAGPPARCAVGRGHLVRDRAGPGVYG